VDASRRLSGPDVEEIIPFIPVTLREGDVYDVGSTFSVDVTDPAQAGFWGAHDLAQSNRADVAFVVAKYDFPPPAYTPNFVAVLCT
jgi:hypothetical protein